MFCLSTTHLKSDSELMPHCERTAIIACSALALLLLSGKPAIAQHSDPDPNVKFVETERKKAGGWEFVLARNSAGTDDEDISGHLLFNGQNVPPKGIHACVKTPWGDMRFFASAENLKGRRTVQGWLPKDTALIPWSVPPEQPFRGSAINCKYQESPDKASNRDFPMPNTNSTGRQS